MFKTEYGDSKLYATAPQINDPGPLTDEWNDWDDWRAYNLDATWHIPQGSCQRVRSGNVGFLKTCSVRPGELA